LSRIYLVIYVVGYLLLMSTTLPNSWAVDIKGTPADDSLVGTAADDDIQGRNGDDNINGLQGNDEIEGQQGNDLLTGSDGNDYLTGGGDSIFWMEAREMMN